jgi:hypothetical protein
MFGDLMTADFSSAPYLVISRITLALFEDTGWYKVNYDWA